MDDNVWIGLLAKCPRGEKCRDNLSTGKMFSGVLSPGKMSFNPNIVTIRNIDRRTFAGGQNVRRYIVRQTVCRGAIYHGTFCQLKFVLDFILIFFEPWELLQSFF